jgi:hypothetical protein
LLSIIKGCEDPEQSHVVLEPASGSGFVRLLDGVATVACSANQPWGNLDEERWLRFNASAGAPRWGEHAFLSRDHVGVREGRDI